MLKRIYLWTVLMLSLCSIAGHSVGQVLPTQQIPNQNQLDRTAPNREVRSPQVNGRITERQAVNLARQRFQGNILRISLIGEGANQRYQIRMENEGKVFTVFVNATTGRVSGGN